ncbi:MAG: hypothetical protein LBG20_04200 [Holosporaceae bacterium]|jgi:hypothetical protein|nr:hypothetical protein [Holosporaceae bacterium]
MYKIGALVLLTTILIIKMVELDQIEDQKIDLQSMKNSIEAFAKGIRICDFSFIKSKEKIFENEDNPREIIGKISKKLNIPKLLMKHGSFPEEIKITVNQERKIYAFVEGLIFELPGIVRIESLNISQIDQKKEFTALIRLKAHRFKEQPMVRIKPDERRCISINFFEKAKPHRLLGITGSSKAYVDNKWLSVGDTVDNDEHRISRVGPNFIEIQDRDFNTQRLKLGASW